MMALPTRPPADGRTSEDAAFLSILSKAQGVLADPRTSPDALLLVADAITELTATCAIQVEARKPELAVLNALAALLQAEAGRRFRRAVPTAFRWAWPD